MPCVSCVPRTSSHYRRHIATNSCLINNSKVLPDFFSRSRLEPRSEKTGLRGLLQGPTQTGLYSHRRWLEA